MLKIIISLIVLFSQHTYGQTILFLGDSLTEGYGINKEDAYPNLVQKMIKDKLGKDIKIINGGVSGSTTNDALSRLKWYLKKKPTILFLALGANDGLRGLKVEQTKNNLQAIIDHAKKNELKILMAGMLMPPNYGKDYTEKFKLIYENLKIKNKITSMPFLLKGIAGEVDLNQSDGIHPNEKGHKVLAKEVFNFIKDEL